MRFFTFIFAFLFCLQPFTIMAELYRWTDENRVVHFSKATRSRTRVLTSGQ